MSINTDEAAALGAVYQAAHLSKGFKVKPFGVKDATLYPIQVGATTVLCFQLALFTTGTTILSHPACALIVDLDSHGIGNVEMM